MRNILFNKKLGLLGLILLLVTNLLAIEPHFMENPAISPDGEQVCFAYMGDLWLVPFSGGEAKQLITSDGKESFPVFSPDGSKIAFNSNMDGYDAVYMIPAEGGEAECISNESLTVRDWFSRRNLLGKVKNGNILATGYNRGLGYSFNIIPTDKDKRPYEISKIGGFYCNISPDNKKIIYQKSGYTYRERYKGSHNGNLWVYDIKDDSYTQLTETDYTEAYPVFSRSDNEIFFAAADFVDTNEAVFQIYKADINNLDEKKQITDFSAWSARKLSIAKTNDRMVFEKFDEIWKYDPQTSKVSKLDIQINKDILPTFVIEEKPRNVGEKYAVSPDGKFVVFNYKFDLFAVPLKGGEVKQITNDHSGIHDLAIMPDNKTIYFTKFESGLPALYKTFIDDLQKQTKVKKIADKVIEDIIVSDKKEAKLLVIYSDDKFRHKLAAINENGDVEKLVIDKHVRDFRYSPDDKYAFFTTFMKNSWNTVLWLKNFKTDTTEMILPFDGYMSNLHWGEYGNFVFFNKNGEINRIFLQPRDDFWLEEDHWEEIIHAKADKEKQEEEEKEDKEEDKEEESEKKDDKEETVKITIETDLIRKRIEEIDAEPGYNQLIAVAPDSTIYYLNHHDDDYALYKMKYDGSKNKKFHSLPDGVEQLRYHKEDDCFYFIQGNTIKKLTSDKKVKVVKNEFDYSYNEINLNKKVFQQIWRVFGWGFYDPDMHEVDWGKIYEKYAPYIKYTYTPRILDKIASEMIGDVNASHTGFYPRKNDGVEEKQIAFIGAEFDNSEVLKTGIKIKKIYNKSKLKKPYEIAAGDILLAVDGNEITSETAIAPLFYDRVGEKIELKIKSQATDSVQTFEIKGLSYWQQRSMYYDNWVDERRDKTTELNDDIGYMHIRHMGWSSFEKFKQDLLAHNYDKDAIILDVRNNPGGYIHDYLIELLTKKPYAYTTNRIFKAKKRNYPHEVWQKPIVLLINKNSFSDAEIFPILFQQFGFGKVIGTPTSGSVIGTGHYNFMDGSSMRLPGTGWFTIEGKNMEGLGATPDIYIKMSPKQKINDNDVQLKRAVEELEKELSK